MKKTFIAALITIFIFIWMAPIETTSVDIVETPPQIQYEDFDFSIEYVSTESSIETEMQSDKYINYLTDLINNPKIEPSFKKQEIKTAWSILYQYKDVYIKQLQEEAARAAEEAKWAERARQYPVATRIWRYMKDNFGWSDAVCAGIIGNILAEAGGGYTMQIPTKIATSGPYGLCQWLGGRKNYLVKKYGYHATVEQQLEFMYDELYGTDGVRKQVSNSKREQILNAETPEDAAMKFCRWFERPGGKGLIRKSYARKVYNYFTS